MSAFKNNWMLLVPFAVLIVAAVVVAIFLKWTTLPFAFKSSEVVDLLGPVAVVAAVIERAVEILLSPWRDAGAGKLKEDLAAKQQANTTDAQAQKTASDQLAEYKGATQRYAFAISLTFGTFASFVGTRALGPFLDAAKFNGLKTSDPAQYMSFFCLDVALSAALLAGGADGIHSVVNAITTFFKSTADKAKA